MGYRSCQGFPTLAGLDRVSYAGHPGPRRVAAEPLALAKVLHRHEMGPVTTNRSPPSPWEGAEGGMGEGGQGG